VIATEKMLESYPKNLGHIDKAKLVACIRTNLDCADICETTGRVLSRHTGYDPDLTAALETCVTACKSCGDRCAEHASMHEHCKVCAEACRRCESACRELFSALD
jgi:hypothetical protein